jgi:transposase InsO family protein
MTAMYSMLGVSKQSVSQKLTRQFYGALTADAVVDLAAGIRDNHPRMGCRKMYWKSLSHLPLGRDRCERILLSRGFRVQFPANFKRTTYAIGKLYYSNLIEGLQLSRLNHVWQSDITYFEVRNTFYYLVFIEDIYSRRIVGWSVDESLWADANISALRKAIELRASNLQGLIHHSDRGGQYIDKNYIRILRENGISSSMCSHGWENAYIERINGIIKNEYLEHWSINSFQELKQAVERAVKLYNNDRPHWLLPNRLSPVAFEEKLNTGFWDKRPTMSLYSKKVET